MSDTQIETLLREIRDLQAATLDEIRGHNRGVEVRSDIVFGNVQRNRVLTFIFLALALGFIAAVALYLNH
jgi:hypothetical protein